MRSRLGHPLARVALTLAFVPWLIAPGVIQPDTKIDLVVSPWRYLRRALDAWSTHSGFGELQNQAYGYLFPMGPFFGVLHSLGVPGWAAQRAWWSLLLVVGFSGAALVSRRVVGLSTGAATVAGLAYALSPRVLTLLSELSIETWPGMLLPWFVLAVHRAARTRRWGRLLAHVGLLTAALGGVNATASLVPVLGGAIAAACLVRGQVRRRLIGAYVVGAAFGAAWWLGPLVVLGGYAYPFMDYIETSHITTAVTTLPAILRGASDWVAYIVDASGHPVWQSGWVVAQGTMSILATSALAGVGLAGLAVLARRRRVAVTFGVMLAVGVVAMAAGYAGDPSGPQSGAVRQLLDGPLAAARNVHKIDPLVRLPLVVGLGAVTQRLVDARRAAAARNTPRAGVMTRVSAVALLAVLLGSVAPFWSGRLADAGGVRAWPSSVPQAAREIDARAARSGGSTLVLPSARTADYAWGAPGDEPLTAFAASPVAVRASAPLYHPGAQRLVDAIDSAVAAGHDVTAALAAAHRAGVRRIAVRWGLSASQQTTSAARYVAALSASADADHHAAFGSGTRRIDVFDLGGATGSPAVSDHAVTRLPVLGGPESTLTLAAIGIDAARPLDTGADGGWITDDVRRRVYANGRPASLAYGPTLAADDAAPDRLGLRDLSFPGRERSLAHLVVTGASSISSSASTSDPSSSPYLGPGTSPSAAFDASATTRWLTPLSTPASLDVTWRFGAAGQRLSMTGAASGGARVTGVRARVDGRALPVRVAPHGWVVDIPRGTRVVNLLPLGVGGGAQAAIGFSTVTSSRPIDAVVALPGAVEPGRSGVVMSRTHPWAMGAPLASEDDGPWMRRVQLAGSATVNLDLTMSQGRPVAQSLRWRSVGGAWHAAGATRTLALPEGPVEFMAGPAVERIVLSPTGATARSALGLDPPVERSGGQDVSLAATQGANAGWRTASGRGTLVALDGWRQGVVAGAARDRLVFGPQTAHRAALGAGLACVVVLLGLAAVDARRSRGALVRHREADDALDGGSPGDRADVAGTLVGGLAVASVAVVALGWVALPAGLLALAVPARHRALVILSAMTLVGPVMAMLGVVAKGSAGAWCGQVLTAFALLVLSGAMLGAPTGWRAVRSGPSWLARGRGSRRASR